MQDKSKIRLEIDYLEHQRDYFDAEVTDKLKELNELLNMEKTQVTAEWLIEKGFKQSISIKWRFVFKNFIVFDFDDFTVGIRSDFDCFWLDVKKQYTHEVEELIYVLTGERI